MADTEEMQKLEAHPDSKRYRVSYEWEKGEEIEGYAAAKDLTVPAFLKFAARQYMDRYPGKGAARAKGVHPEASGGVL